MRGVWTKLFPASPIPRPVSHVHYFELVVIVTIAVLTADRRVPVDKWSCAAVLNMSQLDFIQHASDLGIPYLRVTADDLEGEIRHERSP